MARAFEIPGFPFSLEAGQDLSANQHRFVSLAADGQVDPTGAGLKAIGVQQNNPSAQGEAVSIMTSGISKVVCGATVTINDNVMSDATGRAITATATNVVQGTALQTGAVGELIAVLLETRVVL